MTDFIPFLIQLIVLAAILAVTLIIAVWRLAKAGVEVEIVLPIVRVKVGSVAGGGDPGEARPPSAPTEELSPKASSPRTAL